MNFPLRKYFLEKFGVYTSVSRALRIGSHD